MTGRSSSLNDDAVVARLREGDTEILRAVYEREYRGLWELAYAFVRDETAEDIVHDVFAALWRQRETLSVREGLRAYLFGAVRHRALNVLRQHRFAAKMHGAIDTDGGVVPGLARPHPSPAAEFEGSALEVAVHEAINALPAGQREAILLHWRHGLSNVEVGAAMGTSANAATVQIARARAALRKALVPWLDERER